MSTEIANLTAPVTLTDGAKKEIKKLISKKVENDKELNELEKISKEI